MIISFFVFARRDRKERKYGKYKDYNSGSTNSSNLHDADNINDLFGSNHISSEPELDLKELCDKYIKDIHLHVERAFARKQEPSVSPTTTEKPQHKPKKMRESSSTVSMNKTLNSSKKPKNNLSKAQKQPETGCKNMGGKKVYLVADNGKMLARCNGCGPGSSKDSAGVHGKRGDGFAIWTLEDIGDKCAIKADTGKYASRCNGCWKKGAYPDSVFVHVDNAGPAYSLWTIEKHGDSYAFKSDTGKYMARCNGCVPKGKKSDFAFVHADSPVSYALWKIEMA